MGTVGPAAATAERFAEHSHAAGQADPREERGPADEEGSKKTSKAPERDVAFTELFEFAAFGIVVGFCHQAARRQWLPRWGNTATLVSNSWASQSMICGG